MQKSAPSFLLRVILHPTPAEGAVVSVWFSPGFAGRCWAAALQCSSAEDNRKEAQSN